jgi:hypothetical protein
VTGFQLLVDWRFTTVFLHHCRCFLIHLSVLDGFDAGDVAGMAGDGFGTDHTQHHGPVQEGGAEGMHADDAGILGFVAQADSCRNSVNHFIALGEARPAAVGKAWNSKVSPRFLAAAT